MVSHASLERELRRVIEGEVRFDRGTAAIYSTDASNYRQVPVGVVIPRHEEDVVRAVRLARENAVPILARGGGTSLSGQTCNTALVLDFSKYMNAIQHIDRNLGLAVVQPGVVQSHLNTALAPYGLFFAPDPATKDRCTIGGMLGNNSCGAHSAAYGKSSENLLALDVLLYDGTRLKLGPVSDAEFDATVSAGGRTADLYQQLRGITARYGDLVRSRFPKIPRRVSGYNLDELLPENGFNLARALVGSEGTLGITLSATVRAVPRPKQLVLVTLGFSDIYVAADSVPWILKHHPEALEGFDQQLVEFGKIKGLEAIRLLPSGCAFLIVELGGATLDEARGRGEALMQQAKRMPVCTGSTLLTDPIERDSVWRLRESGLGAGAARPGFPRTWPGAEDVAVAPAKLGAYLRRFTKLLDKRQLRVSIYYGHFGEGCVHCRVSFDLMSPEGIAIFRATMEELGDLVGEFGGSISGEHGDGIGRSELLPRMFGSEMIGAFGEFKRAFDPDWRLNPGSIVQPHPLDSHLKLGPNYRPLQIATHFDFSADGGLAGAALRCVGVGKCRKTDAGTMCPSYMATREELHSTRGRARVLFEALNGGLPGGFTDEAMHEALDLCLSCKSCKTECPAAVDMAMYKAEFLSHYHQQHRRPLIAHALGRINEWAALASRAPSLVNSLSHSFLARPLKRALGIHPKRDLPRFAKQTFRAWFGSRNGAGDSRPEVVLFPDTFNNFYDPEVAIAGTRVLESAGFRVTIPATQICCGRPLYDQGMLDVAKERLRECMRVLGPYVERGVPVVGLEPGCILTFRDELPRLFPSEPVAQALAKATFMLDEFLVRHAPAYSPPTRSGHALLHGHCHQKAISGLKHETALLGRVSGLQLEVLDAGCCGLAGAFGYEADHYEISKTLAERVLVPAIQRSKPGTIVISDGFSCRSQVRHFCPEARVVHLAQVLDQI
ncbi:MAG: FAD-binding and (Fe-S)-binding domain-containing protein [Terriglobales bacterium]